MKQRRPLILASLALLLLPLPFSLVGCDDHDHGTEPHQTTVRLRLDANCTGPGTAYAEGYVEAVSFQWKTAVFRLRPGEAATLVDLPEGGAYRADFKAYDENSVYRNEYWDFTFNVPDGGTKEELLSCSR